jgi:integrase
MTIITARTQNSAKAQHKRYDIACELRQGFLLRVEPTGSMSYKYRRRERNAMKVTTLSKVYDEALALYDAMVTARVRQQFMMREASKGQRVDELFLTGDIDTLRQSWLDNHCQDFAMNTYNNYNSSVKRLQAYAGKGLGHNVTTTEARQVIKAFLREVGKTTPVQSNRMKAAYSSMFKYGEQEDLVSGTPMFGIGQYKEEPKSTYLTEADLKELLCWLSQCDIESSKVDALKLILLTGMRSGEVLGLRESNVDLEKQQVHLKKTKNGHDFIVALPDAAVHLLRQRIEAQGVGKKLFKGTIWGLLQATKRGCKRAHVQICTPHDFRRTCATMLGQEGVSMELIGRILNHSSATASVTAKHYALYDMEKEKRAALELVAAKLKQLGMRV